MNDAAVPLQPLPYHREIVAYLKSEQEPLWKWYESARVSPKSADETRLALLKSAVRVDADTSPRLHELAKTAAERLHLAAPITLYHSQRGTSDYNAFLAYVPGEVHLVLDGQLAEMLDDCELLALFGHELSHYALYTNWNGEFFVAKQILEALTQESEGVPVQESLRIYRLSAEIFCDRGGLLACGDLLATVSALVKIATGVKQLGAESYLKQADEIFSREEVQTQGVTHPEYFVRARALRIWHEQKDAAEPELRRMIDGVPSFSRMDLLAQRELANRTRKLIDALLSHPWMQTELNLGHARLFFESYQPPSAKPRSVFEAIDSGDTALRDYVCYVLLDFVSVDRSLDEAPLAAAFQLTDQLQASDRFEEIVRKELGLRKGQVEKLRRNAAELIAQAAEVPSS